MSICRSLTRVSFCIFASVLLYQPSLALAAETESQTPINQVQTGAGTNSSSVMMNATEQNEPSHYHDDNNLYALNGVSSSDFGASGPISVAGLYDNQVGYYMDAMGSMPFGDKFAGALELSGGEYIFRSNATLGYAINPKNRIKATVEYLDEKLEYDFDSGTIRHWDGQMAYGADYEYVFGGKYVDAFDVGGYYSHAGSDHLDPKTVGGFTTGRYVTGSDNYDVNALVKYHFWPKSQFKTGLRWDRASYDYRYEDEEESGLGVILGMDQLITEQIKFSLDSSIGAVDDTITGQLGVLVPAPKGTRLELSYVTDYVHGHTTDRDYFTNGLKAAFSWGYPKNNKAPSYTADFGPINKQTLQQWTSDPAVRMSEVLAFADQATAAGNNELDTRAAADQPFMNYCPENLLKSNEDLDTGKWYADANEEEQFHGVKQPWSGGPVNNLPDPEGDVDFAYARIDPSDSDEMDHGVMTCAYSDGTTEVDIQNDQVYVMAVDTSKPEIQPTVSAATLKHKARKLAVHRKTALYKAKSARQHQTASSFKKKRHNKSGEIVVTPWGAGEWESITSFGTTYGTCDGSINDDNTLKGNAQACQFQAEYSGDVETYHDSPNMVQYNCAKDPDSCEGNDEQSQLAKRFAQQLARYRVTYHKLAKLQQRQKIQALENKLKKYKKKN